MPKTHGPPKRPPATLAKVSDPKKPRKLPSELVANAKRATLVARREKTARIKTLLASIRDRKRTLVGAYWDIGRDLAELRAMHAEVLLGYGSFSALCKAECGLSDAFVAGAIRVAKELSREAAIDLGSQRRAVAFLDLARVTPEDGRMKLLALVTEPTSLADALRDPRRGSICGALASQPTCRSGRTREDPKNQ
jgi:hypothetical protein